jgi:HK97 family phage major capsid protein
VSQILTSSFNGTLCPPELQTAVSLAVLAGNPFSANLTIRPISRSEATFPILGPTGMDWVAEGAALPEMDLGDDAYVSRPAKLAGIFDISSESWSDNETDLGGMLSEGVAQASLAKLDAGLVAGTGVAPQPLGILELAPAASVTAGSTTRSGAFVAAGELAGQGAIPGVIFLNPADYFAEAGREDSNGNPIYPAGLTELAGCRIVPAPHVPAGTGLVIDPGKVFLIQRDTLAIQVDPSAGFRTDTVACRVRGRFSVAVPVPARAVRQYELAPAA